MVQEFDLFATIDRLAREHCKANASRATTILLSPNAYRWLVEFKARAHAIGNLVICCSPLAHVLTSEGELNIVIDEMCPDTELKLR